MIDIDFIVRKKRLKRYSQGVHGYIDQILEAWRSDTVSLGIQDDLYLQDIYLLPGSRNCWYVRDSTPLIENRDIISEENNTD